MDAIQAAYFWEKAWFIYGRMTRITRDALRAAIEQRGGRVVAKAHEATDGVVVRGPTPDPLYATQTGLVRAAAKGARLVGELDMLWLLDGVDPFAPGFQSELEPLPEALARVHYPDAEVGVEGTYFGRKRWAMFGTPVLGNTHSFGARHRGMAWEDIRAMWSVEIGARAEEARERGEPVQRVLSKAAVEREARASGVSWEWAASLEEADFILYEGETPMWGERLRPELEAARARGVPIFGAHDAMKLLRHELPAPLPLWSPTQRVSSSLAELRQAVHTEQPMSEAWLGLQRVLGSLKGETLALGVDYVNDALDRLPVEERRGVALESSDPWLRQALQHHPPALGVVRMLRVRKGLSQAEADRLFSCTHLDRVEHLDVSTQQPLPEKRWAGFIRAEHMVRLERLTCWGLSVSAKAMDRWVQAPHVQRLHRLDVDFYRYNTGAPGVLFAPGTLPELESLTLLPGWNMLDWRPMVAASLFNRRAFPRLRVLKLHMVRGRRSFVLPLLAMDWQASIRELALVGMEPEHFGLLAESPLWEGLESIRLECVGRAPHHEALWRNACWRGVKRVAVAWTRPSRAEQRLVQALTRNDALAETLEVLELPSWSRPLPELTKALSKAHLPQLRSVTVRRQRVVWDANGRVPQ